MKLSWAACTLQTCLVGSLVAPCSRTRQAARHHTGPEQPQEELRDAKLPTGTQGPSALGHGA